MTQDFFRQIVERAIEKLPSEFKNKLDNMDIVVEDFPSPVHLKKAKVKNKYELLGLYEGVPLTARGTSYGMVLPDKISIFRQPIEASCRSESDIETAIYNTLYHEIAHHFGFSEKQLSIIEKNKRGILRPDGAINWKEYGE